MKCDECRQNEITEPNEFCNACLIKTKECKGCLVVKTIFDFEKNQRTPNGMRSRRSECKNCRKGRAKTIPKAIRDAFEKDNPRPVIGDIFECPLCKKLTTVAHNQDVNLDHDHETGEIRGWVCGSCNTSIGRLGDDISILARAILWIHGKGGGH